eukprot:455261_1
MNDSKSITYVQNTVENPTNPAKIKPITNNSKNEQHQPNEQVFMDNDNNDPENTNETTTEERDLSYSIESLRSLKNDDKINMDFDTGRDLFIKPSEQQVPTTTVNCNIEMIETKHDDNDNIQSKIHNALKSTNHQQTVAQKFNKDVVFFRDYLFWIRIIVLILSIFLLIISTSYCASQLIDVKLQIFTPCNTSGKGKTTEEIWKHSYKIYEEHGQVMDVESQHGKDDRCMIKHAIGTYNPNIWYYNQYITSDWKTSISNAYIVFFGLLSIFLIIVIVLNILTLITDIITIKQNQLHKKSSLYNEYMMEDNKSKKTDVQKEIDINDTIKNKLIKCLKALHGKYFADDTTGWILMKFISELTEFIIQSQVLFLYNGYNKPNCFCYYI